jgi:hypothetical protein
MKYIWFALICQFCGYHINSLVQSRFLKNVFQKWNSKSTGLKSMVDIEDITSLGKLYKQLIL